MFLCEIDNEITLRLLQTKHTDELHSLVKNNLDHLGQWIPWVAYGTSKEQIESYMRSVEEQLKHNSAVHVGIWYTCDKAGYDDDLVGVVSTSRIDWANKTLSLGYWIEQNAESLSLVSRPVRFLIEFAFNELNMNRIEIRCAPENLASRRIPERLHFTQEGVLREAEQLNGRFVDHVLYSLLASDHHAREEIRERMCFECLATEPSGHVRDDIEYDCD